MPDEDFTNGGPLENDVTHVGEDRERKQSRRRFISNIALALGLTGLGTAGGMQGYEWLRDRKSAPVNFDIEGEIREGHIKQASSINYNMFGSGKQEDAFKALKAAIDKHDVTGLTRELKKSIYSDQDKGGAVVAKAMTYLLVTGPMMEEDMHKAILAGVPYARDIQFTTLNATDTREAVVKSLPELARDGYEVDLVASGSKASKGVVIAQDPEMGQSLSNYIATLPKTHNLPRK